MGAGARQSVYQSCHTQSACRRERTARGSEVLCWQGRGSGVRRTQRLRVPSAPAETSSLPGSRTFRQRRPPGSVRPTPVGRRAVHTIGHHDTPCASQPSALRARDILVESEQRKRRER